MLRLAASTEEFCRTIQTQIKKCGIGGVFRNHDGSMKPVHLPMLGVVCVRLRVPAMAAFACSRCVHLYRFGPTGPYAPWFGTSWSK